MEIMSCLELWHCCCHFWYRDLCMHCGTSSVSLLFCSYVLYDMAGCTWTYKYVFLLPLLAALLDMHIIRFNCYIGSASIFILCIALCRGGWQRFSHDEDDDTDIYSEEDDVVWFKIPSIKDVLFSFPITMLAFLCHFNIISIQNAPVGKAHGSYDTICHWSILPVNVSIRPWWIFICGQ